MMPVADAAPLAGPPAAARGFWTDQRTTALLLLAITTLIFCGLIAKNFDTVLAGRPLRADDLMRLAQVRDWLAGQSWFDVTQYRVAPDAGLSMHWSRLVDIPIATLLAGLTPLLGRAGAEAVTLVAVPFATLCCAVLVLVSLLRPLLSRGAVLLAVPLALLSFDALFQFAPGRIDHHGWQIVLGLLLLRSVLRNQPLLAGLWAGVWLHVSFEGLPYAVLGGVVIVADAYVHDRGRLRQATAYAFVLAAVSAVLFVGTRLPESWFVPFCDAIGPGHLAALGVFAAGTTTLLLERVRSNTLLLLACLAASAGLAMSVLWAVTPQCVATPFGALDPIVRLMWYDRVMEGRPIWVNSSLPNWAVVVTFALGLTGLGFLYRDADGGTRRMLFRMVVFAIGAVLCGILVRRANVFALFVIAPGLATVAMVAFRRAARLEPMPLRVVAKLLIGLLVVPGMLMLTLMVVDLHDWSGAAPARTRTVVAYGDEAVAAAAKRPALAYPTVAEASREWPAQRMLAPLDMAGHMLFATPHTVLAGGYHRGSDALAALLDTFVGTSDDARDTMDARGLTGVVAAFDLSEGAMLRSLAPQGFAAQLGCGRAPSWLVPDERSDLRTALGVRVFWRLAKPGESHRSELSVHPACQPVLAATQ